MKILYALVIVHFIPGTGVNLPAHVAGVFDEAEDCCAVIKALSDRRRSRQFAVCVEVPREINYDDTREVDLASVVNC